MGWRRATAPPRPPGERMWRTAVRVSSGTRLRLGRQRLSQSHNHISARSSSATTAVLGSSTWVCYVGLGVTVRVELPRFQQGVLVFYMRV
jgi:hypothetical protein